MLGLLGHIGAVVARARLGIGSALNIILHIGAHRTGTTSFQNMLRATASDLRDCGIVVWEPKHTRDGRFAGLICPQTQFTPQTQSKAMKSLTGIQFELDRLDSAGVKTLLISEENMLGQMRCNLAAHRLYPDARFRLGQFSRVFRQRVSRVVMAVRAQDAAWRSTLSYGLSAGLDLVAGTDFDALAASKRRWQHVVADAGRAFASAKLAVWQFEALLAAPNAQLAAALGAVPPVPARQLQAQHNRSPDARALRMQATDRGLWRMAKMIPDEPAKWQPFTSAQRAAFQAAYAKDLNWLQAQSGHSLEFYDNENGVCTQTNPDRGSFDDKRGQRMG